VGPSSTKYRFFDFFIAALILQVDAWVVVHACGWVWWCMQVDGCGGACMWMGVVVHAGGWVWWCMQVDGCGGACRWMGVVVHAGGWKPLISTVNMQSRRLVFWGESRTHTRAQGKEVLVCEWDGMMDWSRL
jgi:hypothetical protein